MSKGHIKDILRLTSYLLPVLLVSILYIPQSRALGLGLGPIGNFTQSSIATSDWDFWESSWGGGVALQADLDSLSFEIDALLMQRKYRHNVTKWSVTTDTLYTVTQIEVPILLYMRTGSFMGPFRLGGGVGNNFGQGRVIANTRLSIANRTVKEGKSLMSFSDAGFDGRSMDGILAFGWDLSLLLLKIKADFENIKYQIKTIKIKKT